MDGVLMDWCAPPSAASVTPDGVPTRIDWPPAYIPNDHGSSARSTKGSYMTPMGTGGCPQRSQGAPGPPMRPPRLVSAMPSSMCCPLGCPRQCRIVSASSANQFGRSEEDQTPTLLTQPP